MKNEGNWKLLWTPTFFDQLVRIVLQPRSMFYRLTFIQIYVDPILPGNKDTFFYGDTRIL